MSDILHARTRGKLMLPGGGIDDDHQPLWIPRAEALNILHHTFFHWAVEQTERPT